MLKLVGVGDIKMALRIKQNSVIAEREVVFSIAPPSGRFKEKRRLKYLFAMVNLGGVRRVSGRFEHFFGNPKSRILPYLLRGVAS